MTLVSGLNEAIERITRGDWDGAETLLNALRRQTPNDPDICHLLGVVILQKGDAAGAVPWLTHAHSHRPDHPAYRLNLAVALGRLGRFGEVVALMEEGLQGQPQCVEFWVALGNALQDAGLLPRAIDAFTHAHALRPDDPLIAYNLGNAWLRRGRHDRAEACYRASLDLNPDQPLAWCNLGTALQEQGQFEAALAAFTEAIDRAPDYADARYNLGNALQELGRHVEAETAYRRALELRPDFLEARVNLGNALMAQAREAEAEALHAETLQTRPDSAEAHNGLALSRFNRGWYEGVVEHYRAALRLRPDFPEAHKNLALALLTLGEWEEGFEHYEWRFRCRDLGDPGLPGPRWEGANDPACTLLVYAEQGAGDAIQFLRYLPLALERVGRVVLAAPARLNRLLRGLASDAPSWNPDRVQVVPIEQPLPRFDAHVPLLSLPRVFQTRPDRVPAPIPYLRAEPELIARWSPRVRGIEGLKLGIAWKGAPGYPLDRHRSLPLAAFGELARLDAVRLIALQQGPGRDQLADLGGRFEVIDLGAELDLEGDAFVETAAVVTQLDAVVSCDSALGHLAGALGKPVWLALPRAQDWRWLLDRADTPWYPHHRLIRQRVPGEWRSVFQAIAREVADHFGLEKSDVSARDGARTSRRTSQHVP